MYEGRRGGGGLVRARVFRFVRLHMCLSLCLEGMREGG